MSKYPYISNAKCKNCGGDIIIKRSRDKNNEFCGTSCVGKFYRTKNKEYVNCLFCGKEFVKTCRTKNMFCSTQCHSKSKIKEHKRTCEKCGIEFISHNIANINRGKDRFCSQSCAARKYNVNENYFEKINNQNKAYILGFIYADGCLSKKKYELIIKLNIKDLVILENIKKELKSEHPIKIINVNRLNNQCSLRISSKKLCNSLMKIGLTPAKTFTIKFPELNNNFIRHFIRGYFDGDGCLLNPRKKYNTFNIFTASEEFKNKLIEILETNSIKSNVYCINNGFSINITNFKNTLLFYNYIYKNSKLYLKRKKDKWILRN